MHNQNYKLIIKTVLSILFLGALFKMPYEYYEIMRFLGMIGFIILGCFEIGKSNKTFMIIWFSSALLVNPFFKLSLGRGLWNVIDLIWVVILVFSIIKKKQYNYE